MIDLFDVDVRKLTPSNDITLQGKKLVLSKRFYTISTSDRWGSCPPYLKLDEDSFAEYQLFLWDLDRKYSLKTKLNGYKLACELRTISPFTTITLHSINIWGVLIYETYDAKDLVRKQFLLLREVFPVEVLYSVLVQYLSLL